LLRAVHEERGNDENCENRKKHAHADLSGHKEDKVKDGNDKESKKDDAQSKFEGLHNIPDALLL
jgi:hypothetical protein